MNFTKQEEVENTNDNKLKYHKDKDIFRPYKIYFLEELLDLVKKNFVDNSTQFELKVCILGFISNYNEKNYLADFKLNNYKATVDFSRIDHQLKISDKIYLIHGAIKNVFKLNYKKKEDFKNENFGLENVIIHANYFKIVEEKFDMNQYREVVNNM